MKKLIIGITTMCSLTVVGSTTLGAQRPTISLGSAIELARANHAGLAGARLEVEQWNRLEDAGVVKPPSRLFLSGEEFDFSDQAGIHSLNLEQSFYLPKVGRAVRNAYQQEVVVAERRMAITDQKLRMEVSQAFYKVVFSAQALALTEESRALYNRFLDVTTAHLESGETGKMPQLAARTRVGKAALAVEHAEEQNEIAVLLLNQWILSDTVYDVQANLPAPVPAGDDSVHPGNPLLMLRQASIERARAQVVEEEVQLLPQVVSGVKLQTATDLFPLFGYQVGVQVPLFTKGYRGRIEAAELQIQVEEAAATALEREITRKVSELRFRMEHLIHILDFLRDDLAPVVAEQSEINLQAYEEGEVGYLEYLDSLEQELSLKRQALETHFEFILLKLELDYWLGR